MAKKTKAQDTFAEEKKITKKNMPSSKKEKKQGGNLMFIIALIVLAIVVAIVFAYTNGKLSKLQGHEKNAQNMQEELDLLKKELNTLSSKAKILEEENKQNEEILIDLFDKNRSFPSSFETKDWLVYNNADLNFKLQIPEYWEVAKATVNTKEVEKPTVSSDEKTEEKVETQTEKKNQQIIYLQPKNDAVFALAITIKNDYLDLSSLSLAEKKELFAKLTLIDQRDFSQGTMMYYIDIDGNQNKIPTVLILTQTDIYKATFNVTDKSLTNYFKYRLDFEKIIQTFEKTTIAKTQQLDSEAEKKEEKES